MFAAVTPIPANSSDAALHGLRVEPAKNTHSQTLLDVQGQSTKFPLETDKWQLVVFGYAHCADVCPITLRRAALLLRELGDDGARLQPVFISIDGERDTPEAVRDFIRKFDARIVGLTGTPETLQAIANEFSVVVRRFRGTSSLAYQLEHSSFMYLLDPPGRVRLLYSASSDPAGIARDLRKLWGTPQARRARINPDWRGLRPTTRNHARPSGCLRCRGT